MDVVLSKGPTPEEGKWNNQDLKVMIQWFKRAGDMSMPKNKEGLLLRYREMCCRVVTHQNLQPNPEPNLTTGMGFTAAALGAEPPSLAPGLAAAVAPDALVLAPSPATTDDAMVNTTKDTTATILVLDPAAAARTGRPKDDTEDVTAPPALTDTTTASAWDEDEYDIPLGPTDPSLYDNSVSVNATTEDVHLRLLGEESEHSSDDESVFDLMEM